MFDETFYAICGAVEALRLMELERKVRDMEVQTRAVRAAEEAVAHMKGVVGGKGFGRLPALEQIRLRNQLEVLEDRLRVLREENRRGSPAAKE